jgi:hypothetical protein
MKLSKVCKDLNFLFIVYIITGLLFAETKAQSRLNEQEWEKIIGPAFIQRTMHLLAESTPDNRNTVRILVYGQSLSAQDWWLLVRRQLEIKYPNANLVMENKAIGGFASQFLIKTVRRDVLDFYPDLIIFHVFGSDFYYEQVLREMRSLTSTEIMIWNDPQNKPEPDPWHEEMSYQIIPALASKYNCKFIDIRTPIQELIVENGLVYADEYTRDGLHFNEEGCKLIAQHINPHFIYDPDLEPDPDHLLTVFEVGKDVHWVDGVLQIDFEGNRIDVVTPSKPDNSGSCSILVDGRKPSEFAEAYNHTRPNDNGDKGWIWSVGAPVRIQRKAPWINETFTLIYDSIDYRSRFFSFHIIGSESGYEGKGCNREDFVSVSGRVFIQANEVNDSLSGDWHVFRSHDVTGFSLEKGYETRWETYLMGSDHFVPLPKDDNAIENETTLFKGIPNGRHQLSLVCRGQKMPDIIRIKVYKPLIRDSDADGD